jgi:hypothetical protein
LENNMDMKQLIAQIDHIENKQILNEDAHYTAAQVDNRPQVSKSNTQTSIYEMLIKEFGYDLNEAPAVPNPYQGADAAKFAAMSPADQAWLTKGGGQPDINDEIILSRAPNKGAAVVKPAAGGAAQPAPAQIMDPNQADKDDAQMGADVRANAAGGNSTSAATGVGNPGEEAAATAQANAAPAAAQTAAIASGAQDDVTGVDAAVATQAAAPAAPAGGAAQPAKAAANKSMTPAINAYASRMGLMKNNKPDVAAIKKFQQDNGLKADGIIGPNTAGAIISAGSGANMGGGGGGPAPAVTKPAGGAAQPAPAVTKPAGGAAQPAAPVDPTKLSVSQRIATQPSVIDQARAKLGIPAGGTSPTKEDSVRAQDDAILERIRTALFR